MRSDTSRIDNSGVNAFGVDPKASQLKRAKQKLLPKGATPIIANNGTGIASEQWLQLKHDDNCEMSMLVEGESRRIRQTIRHSLSIRYCLESLRIPLVLVDKEREEKDEKDEPSNLDSVNWDPDATLLTRRTMGTLYQRKNIDATVVHLQLMAINHTDAEQSYNASVALDSCLPHWINRSMVGSDRDIEPLDPVCQDGLVDYSTILHSIISPDPGLELRRYQLMFKLLPRKGAPRRFTPILRLYMSEDPALMREIVEITLCSLLGNYRHCRPDSRADLPMRLAFYRVCMPRTMHNYEIGSSVSYHLRRILMAMEVEKLSFFALREYLIFLVDDDPALRKQMNRLFLYEQYRDTVINTMASVRVYIRTNLSHPSGSMTEHKINEGIHIHRLQSMLRSKYQQIVDDDSYRKSQPSPLVQFKNVRGEIPPTLEWARRLNLQVHYCSAPTADEKGSATRSRTMKRKKDKLNAADAKESKRQSGRDDDGDDGDEDGEEEEEDIDLEMARLELEMAESAAAAAASSSSGIGRGRKNRKNEMETMMRYSRLVLAKKAQEVEEAKSGTTVSKKATTTATGATKWRVHGMYEPRSKDSVAITRDGVQVSHCRDLTELIGRIDPDLPVVQAFQLILVMLHAFGAPTDALLQFEEVGLKRYYDGLDTLEEWKGKVARLRAWYPYTYNLLQTAVVLWTRHRSIRRYALPLHYLVGQTRAIASRYGLPYGYTEEQKREWESLGIDVSAATDPPIELSPVPEHLPRLPCMFTYCGVCQRPYSIVRRQLSPSKKEGKRKKADPTIGYVDATVDLLNNNVYCSRQRSVMHDKCGRVPLSSICMLGFEIIYRRQTLMLCPQPGCGHAAVMHPTNTTFTRHGMACYTCTMKTRSEKAAIPTGIMDVYEQLAKYRDTAKERKSQIRKRRKLPDHTKEEEEEGVDERENDGEDEEKDGICQCFLCKRKMSSGRHIIVIGINTFICDHHPGRYVEYVRRGLNDRGYSMAVVSDDGGLWESVARTLLLEIHGLYTEELKPTRKRLHAIAMARVRRATETQRILGR